MALVEHVGQGVEVGALGGMVWWKAVSNTATCGTSGRRSRAARLPLRLGGLCSGARSKHSSIACEHRVVDQHRGLEVLAAVHHAVPDRLDLAPVPEHPVVLAGQQGQHPLDRDLVLQDLAPSP